jgi:hypothetical protein
VVPTSGNPSPTFTLRDQSTRVSANANSAGDGSESLDHTLSNWSAPKNLAADTVDADATASASTSLISASASATGVGDFFLGNTGNGFVGRAAVFDLDGPATLLFSIPFSFSLTGSAGDFSNNGSITINGSASFGDPFAFVPAGTGSQSIAVDTQSNPATSNSGSLVFGLFASRAGTGFLDFNISASASSFSFLVPEPAPLLGVIAGVGAIVVIGRRRVHAA